MKNSACSLDPPGEEIGSALLDYFITWIYYVGDVSSNIISSIKPVILSSITPKMKPKIQEDKANNVDNLKYENFNTLEEQQNEQIITSVLDV